MKKNLLIVAALIIVALGIWYTVERPASNSSALGQNTGANKLIASAFYVCNGGKTINADFYRGEPKPAPAPGEPPIPGGVVKIILSDGRVMELNQTISADGGRYSNGNPLVQGSESFVFWSKGSGALVLEDNEQKNYIGCIQVSSDPGNFLQIYENGSKGFSIRYPAGYTSNSNYQYQEFGPGKEITGVSFTIPASVAEGTNLGQDSYLSVEEIPQEKDCSVNLFLDPGALGAFKPATATDNGITYSVASSTGAGAGNRYEETVYAVPGTNPCIAVRYFIHYSVIENYPPGTVKEFNKQALLGEFDAIRRTLVIQQ
jgi:membrane-bound inhibitor of C-type lysozyme